jgi:uncharacterized protein with ParB-like and HNH nuclease domain
MKAYEKDIAEIVEGKKQYIVPLFQRAYVWEKKHWQTLWDDIYACVKTDEFHFFGTFVVIPIEINSGIKKFLLIDGQQRLTTVFILLSAIRTLSEQRDSKYLSKEIESGYLLNYYREVNNDSYKLLPSKLKKNLDSFKNIMFGQVENAANSKIKEAFLFFERVLRTEKNLDLESLVRVITNKLRIVYIELAKEDDPYKIFESLNATGEALTQADLMRNYIFMRLGSHEQESEDIYNKYWQPMQNDLEDDISIFLRHFLMKEGFAVRINDVYSRFKIGMDALHTKDDVLGYLKQLTKFSVYYAKFLKPEREENTQIRIKLLRIKQLDVTVVYPFLLNVYHSYDEKQINLNDFLQILDIVENFIVRRLICNIPTHGLNRIFPIIYDKAKRHSSLVQGVKNELSSKSYPTDDEFAINFMIIKIYSQKSESTRRARFILNCLEQFDNKEPVDLTNTSITIEHIMPQNLTDNWKSYLGNNFDKVHQKWCNTLGNLTLTASNSGLGQKPFQAKKKVLESSNIRLNRYFNSIAEWREEDIKQRAETLKNIALDIWPYFGDVQEKAISDFTNKKPLYLTIKGEKYTPSSWRDVMELTLNSVIDSITARDFEQIIEDFPKYISWEKDKFYSQRELSNNAYMEANFSANNIYSFCRKIIDFAEFETEDWKLDVE